MKKLYRKSTVHPTPSVVSDQLLSFLPAAILTLTTGLSQEDRMVLAYLISCSSTSFWDTNRKSNQRAAAAAGNGEDHQPCFSCSCFRCYTSYWAKWDASPNRQLIHEIIDAFEDSLLKEKSSKEKSKKGKRKGKNVKDNVNTRLEFDEPKKSELILPSEDSNFGESNAELEGGAETGGGEEEDSVEMELEKGSVRRFVSFLGERIWGVWG